ncbi:MAG: penicillin-binding transpeptidase domain-containing protein [Acutalibacteraceae bacterium]
MAKRGVAAKQWRRAIIVLLVILIAGFGTVSARLFILQTVEAEDLQKRAVSQQLRDTTISAKRGSIYDSTGQILAQSVSVWQIVLAPAYFKTDAQREYVAKGLSELLELDYDNLYEKTQRENSYYVVIKRRVSTDTRDKVLEFIKKGHEDKKIALSSQVIDTLEDYERYYTYDNFAADVLGFTGSDGQGLSGIEYQYNDVLTGTNGRLVTAKDAAGTEMAFQYEEKVDAVDGYNLVLTIDSTIQSIMEKYVRQAIVENKVANRGCAIMMNVKTGAIIGLACEGSYNPNEPYVIADKEALKEIDKIKDEDKKAEAEYAALAKQWRNKAVSDTYYPGSVFKMVTASAVLSEGLIDDDTRFTCSGSYVPFEGSGAISCHYHSGHGTQTLEQALCNSCNPAFMQMGNMLGTTKFYQYYAAFGFSEKTGIDLPGESSDIFFTHDGVEKMDLSDLAVASFGQNFAITPIQMITACAAIANGGNLMQPYMVSQVVDAEGNVIKTTEPTVKRQVISSEVAEQICGMLQQNAIDGGATNGYVAGYRIGGKTGTSEAKRDSNGDGEKDYIASYCGIAPADDAQVAMLVFFDTPTGDSYYGSAVAGPCFRNIMSEVLPYLGIEKQYTQDEMDKLDTMAGFYTGYSLEEAETMVHNDGLKFVVVGNGEKVIDQNPSYGSTIPKDGTIILYTDSSSDEEKTTVPNFTGLTMTEANTLASENHLNLCITGSLQAEGIAYASAQDIAVGTVVEKYTVVTVTFNQNNQIE